MKKILIIASMAAIAMTSCKKEAADSSQSAGNGVEFRTVFDKTKAAPTTVNNMLSFNVNASIDDATSYDFMKDVTVTKRSGAWGFAPAKYWPSTSGDVHFFAYSPADSPNITDVAVADGKTTFTYTAPTTNSTTEDFVLAHNLTSVSGGTASSVALNFKHALSMISFKATNNSTGLNYVIESIKLTNINSTAKFTVTPTAIPTADGYVMAAPTVPQTYVVSVPEAGFALEANATPTAKKLTSENEYVMVLPQTCAASSTVTITYNAKDAYGAYIVRKGTTKVFSLSTKVLDPAKHNEFHLKFAAGDVVTFTPSFVEWPALTPVNL